MSHPPGWKTDLRKPFATLDYANYTPESDRNRTKNIGNGLSYVVRAEARTHLILISSTSSSQIHFNYPQQS
jgi:hypothetical protein